MGNVTYKHAIKLKKFGFDKDVFYYRTTKSDIIEEKGNYNWNSFPHFISLPTYEQAFDWIRLKYGLHCYFKPNNYGDEIIVIMAFVGTEKDNIWTEIKRVISTYEKSKEKSLDILLKLIK